MRHPGHIQEQGYIKVIRGSLVWACLKRAGQQSTCTDCDGESSEIRGGEPTRFTSSEEKVPAKASRKDRNCPSKTAAQTLSFLSFLAPELCCRTGVAALGVSEKSSSMHRVHR
jgi:hypothetical protein